MPIVLRSVGDAAILPLSVQHLLALLRSVNSQSSTPLEIAAYPRSAEEEGPATGSQIRGIFSVLDDEDTFRYFCDDLKAYVADMCGSLSSMIEADKEPDRQHTRRLWTSMLLKTARLCYKSARVW